MNAIEKSFDILEAILNNKNEISIIDLAKVTNQSISTTHRICSILVRKGYLYQKEKGGKYSLGYKFLLFNDIANINVNIKAESYPYLKELSDKISETVTLSVFDGTELVDIFSVVPEAILKVTPGLGTKSPFHCTAIGKIFIANMPIEKMEKILDSQELKAFTERTITDVEQLKQELDNVRKDGVAFDDEEYIMGLRSAAAPIRGQSGEVFATVNFLAPCSRVSSLRMKQLAPLVKNCGLSISRALGYIEAEKVLENLK